MAHRDSEFRAIAPRGVALAALVFGVVACNAALGIDDATLTCDVTACGQQEEEASLEPNGTGSSGSAIVGDAGPSAPAQGASSESGEAPPLAPAEPEPSLDELIAAQCSEQPAGEPFCIGNHRVVCDAASMPRVAVCASAAHCAQGSGEACAACAMTGSVCQGAERWGCDVASGRMVPLETCASPALCSVDGCAPAVCAACTVPN